MEKRSSAPTVTTTIITNREEKRNVTCPKSSRWSCLPSLFFQVPISLTVALLVTTVSSSLHGIDAVDLNGSSYSTESRRSAASSSFPPRIGGEVVAMEEAARSAPPPPMLALTSLLGLVRPEAVAVLPASAVAALSSAADAVGGASSPLSSSPSVLQSVLASGASSSPEIWAARGFEPLGDFTADLMTFALLKRGNSTGLGGNLPYYNPLPKARKGHCSAGKSYTITSGADLRRNEAELECILALGSVPTGPPTGLWYGGILSLLNSDNRLKINIGESVWSGKMGFKMQCRGSDRQFGMAMNFVFGDLAFPAYVYLGTLKDPILATEYKDEKPYLFVDYSVNMARLCPSEAKYEMNINLAKFSSAYPISSVIDLARVVGFTDDGGQIILGKTFFRDIGSFPDIGDMTIMWWFVINYDEESFPQDIVRGQPIGPTATSFSFKYRGLFDTFGALNHLLNLRGLRDNPTLTLQRLLYFVFFRPVLGLPPKPMSDVADLEKNWPMAGNPSSGYELNPIVQLPPPFSKSGRRPGLSSVIGNPIMFVGKLSRIVNSIISGGEARAESTSRKEEMAAPERNNGEVERSSAEASGANIKSETLLMGQSAGGAAIAHGPTKPEAVGWDEDAVPAGNASRTRVGSAGTVTPVETLGLSPAAAAAAGGVRMAAQAVARLPTGRGINSPREAVVKAMGALSPPMMRATELVRVADGGVLGVSRGSLITKQFTPRNALQRNAAEALVRTPDATTKGVPEKNAAAVRRGARVVTASGAPAAAEGMVAAVSKGAELTAHAANQAWKDVAAEGRDRATVRNKEGHARPPKAAEGSSGENRALVGPNKGGSSNKSKNISNVLYSFLGT